jgi:hypothetical protein
LVKEKIILAEKVEEKNKEILRFESLNYELNSEISYMKNDLNSKDSTIVNLQDDLDDTKSKLMDDYEKQYIKLKENNSTVMQCQEDTKKERLDMYNQLSDFKKELEEDYKVILQTEILKLKLESDDQLKTKTE